MDPERLIQELLDVSTGKQVSTSIAWNGLSQLLFRRWKASFFRTPAGSYVLKIDPPDAVKGHR